MPTAEFDTLTVAQELRDSGISEAQAAAIVQAVRSAVTTHAASKTDVAEVLAKIDAARAEAKAENAALRADFYRVMWIQGVGVVTVIASLMVISGAFSGR